MKTLTKYPTVELEGRIYAIVPVEDLPQLPEAKPRVYKGIPLAVARKHREQGVSLARAWREYLELSQEEVATRMGISQPALAQIESARRPRKETLERLADALGIVTELLKG